MAPNPVPSSKRPVAVLSTVRQWPRQEKGLETPVCVSACTKDAKHLFKVPEILTISWLKIIIDQVGGHRGTQRFAAYISRHMILLIN